MSSLLRFAVFAAPFLAGIPKAAAATNGSLSDFPSVCTGMVDTLKSGKEFENVTVNLATYIPAGTNLSLPTGKVNRPKIWRLSLYREIGYNLSTCYSTSKLPYQVVSKDLCRITMQVATSNRSGKSPNFVNFSNGATNY